MYSLTNMYVQYYVVLYLFISYNIFYFEYVHKLVNQNIILFMNLTC